MLALNFNPFPVLTSERLRFRQLTSGDVNAIFRLRSDERVNKFLARKEYKTFEDAGAFINKINRNVRNNECIYWAITNREEDNLMGTICLWNIQPENYRAELGYELYPDFWGKGIMKDAIPRIIHYGFEVLGLHSIEADLDPDNVQSVALLERNGFIKEGYFKESTYNNGRFSDRAVYSLIKSPK